MLLKDVTKFYADNLILHKINAVIGKNDHIGLVGANGVGKTTLLRILAGEEPYDQGKIVKSEKYTIGYLQQLFIEKDISLQAYLEQAFAGLLALKQEMRRLEQELADPKIYNDTTELEGKIQQYAVIQQRWEEQGGYNYQVEIKSVVNGLGLPLGDLAKPLRLFSGGQQMRAQLALLLLEKPDLLLLDEPSNHLDTSALEWLEDFLPSYPRALILVSHDRYFLDKTAEKIWEISANELNRYTGNYSAYQQQRQMQEVQLHEQAAKQQREIAKMEQFINKFRAGTRAKQAKSKAKQLAKLKPVKRILPSEQMKIYLTPKRQSGVNVVEFSQIEKSFDHIVLNQVKGVIRRGERIALLGPNGCGKSTLLKILAGKLDYGGTIKWGVNIDIGYFDQEIRFENNATVLEEIYETYRMELGQARDVLARFLFKGDDVFKQVDDLSGGERNRLLLAKLLLAAPNFLLLDEPTNHLDIYAREALEKALLEFSGTILFASHDRYLVDLLADRLWILTEGTIKEFKGSYSQYQDYLRQEKKRKTTIKKPKEETPKVNNQEKELTKRRQQLEATIAEFEQKKTELEKTMAAKDFYQDLEHSQEVVRQYQSLESELLTYYHQWESIVDAQIKGDQ